MFSILCVFNVYCCMIIFVPQFNTGLDVYMYLLIAFMVFWVQRSWSLDYFCFWHCRLNYNEEVIFGRCTLNKIVKLKPGTMAQSSLWICLLAISFVQRELHSANIPLELLEGAKDGEVEPIGNRDMNSFLHKVGNPSAKNKGKYKCFNIHFGMLKEKEVVRSFILVNTSDLDL